MAGFVFKDVVDSWHRYCNLATTLGIGQVPKNHLLLHMIHRSAVLGSPGCYACWADEGLNRLLKLVLRNCHSANFESMAFNKTTLAIANQAKRRRTK